MQVILRMLVEPMEGERAATFAENEIALLDPLKLLVFKWILGMYICMYLFIYLVI